MHLHKDPFLQDQSFFLSAITQLDRNAMHQAASIIQSATLFKPFCKTGSDNKGYECFITDSKWIFNKNTCSYEISANRFLRGMVRLIVGACINVGLHKISVEELQHAIDTQTTLSQPWSVPAHGLCFMFARYPGEVSR
jgi:tRNA pseudouridine38-40 synthase